MKRNLALFFILTFLFTWAVEIPEVLYKYKFTVLNIPIWLRNLATWAPGLVAITLAAAYGRKQGLKELLKPLVQFKHPIKWYLFALFFGSIVSLISFYSYEIFSGKILAIDPPYSLVLIILVVIPFSPLWEEIGWRGYALPLLQNKYKPVTASLTLGFFWGLWHLPMYLALSSYGDKRMFFFMIVFIGCFPLSILQSWIYNNTKQSMLLCVLFHAGVDGSIGYFFQNLPNNDLMPLLLVTALFFCVAAGIIIITKGKLGCVVKPKEAIA